RADGELLEASGARQLEGAIQDGAPGLLAFAHDRDIERPFVLVKTQELEKTLPVPLDPKRPETRDGQEVLERPGAAGGQVRQAVAGEDHLGMDAPSFGLRAAPAGERALAALSGLALGGRERGLA